MRARIARSRTTADPTSDAAAHALGVRTDGKWSGCNNRECPTCTTAPARPRTATKRERSQKNRALLTALAEAAANGGLK